MKFSVDVNNKIKVTASDEVPGANGVNRDIMNGLTDLMKRAAAHSQSVADLFSLTASDLLALLKLDHVMTMTELSRHMGVDPSFVTTIADTFEGRGLARREPSLRDRRMKNLVLTPEGMAVRERMMQELAPRMPWCHGLDAKERRIFLVLIRKILAGTEHEEGAGQGSASEVDGGLLTARREWRPESGRQGRSDSEVSPRRSGRR